jgi:hypothetical protein
MQLFQPPETHLRHHAAHHAIPTHFHLQGHLPHVAGPILGALVAQKGCLSEVLRVEFLVLLPPVDELEDGR